MTGQIEGASTSTDTPAPTARVRRPFILFPRDRPGLGPQGWVSVYSIERIEAAEEALTRLDLGSGRTLWVALPLEDVISTCRKAAGL